MRHQRRTIIIPRRTVALLQNPDKARTGSHTVTLDAILGENLCIELNPLEGSKR